jgi:hypothetical protein
MVRLTDEQRMALEAGQAVRVQENSLECILLRADVFKRLSSGESGSEFSPQEAYPLVNDALREDDEHDPLLDSYQRYR